MVGRNPHPNSVTHWHVFLPDFDNDNGGGDGGADDGM